MPKYTIYFSESYPDAPGNGSGDDINDEFIFRGSAAAAIREAKRLSFERYHGDAHWWIIELDKLNRPKTEEDKWAQIFNYAKEVHCHTSKELLKIITRFPHSYKSPFQDRITEKIAKEERYINDNSLWTIIDYQVYDGEDFIGSGEQTPWIKTVEEMIYGYYLIKGNSITHVVRKEEYRDSEFKHISLYVDVYEFSKNDALAEIYKTREIEKDKEIKGQFNSLAEILDKHGSTYNIITSRCNNPPVQSCQPLQGS